MIIWEIKPQAILALKISTAKDADGRKIFFPVAPFSPIYAAGYIQDKFSYKRHHLPSWVWGLTTYDANTKVFKDPYALYDIETADAYFDRNPDKTRPKSVGDDYKVYVKVLNLKKSLAIERRPVVPAQWYSGIWW